jgi:uncharacterized protein
LDKAIAILIDADACPVKEEAYRVARRYGVPVKVVSGGGLLVPREPLIEAITAGDGFDAADDWIAERADASSIVVTADILLADRCLKRGATVIAPTGKRFDLASIGHAVAQRALMADLRAMGEVSGGPAPFAKTDRSRFLTMLDEAVNRLRRRPPPSGG